MRDLTFSTSVSSQWAFDKAVAKREGDLDIAAAANRDVIEEWPSFVREVFADLRGDDATARAREPMAFDRWAARAHELVRSAPNYPALKRAGAASRYAAAEATGAIVSAVAESIKLNERRRQQRAEKTADETNAKASSDPMRAAAEMEALAKLGQSMLADGDVDVGPIAEELQGQAKAARDDALRVRAMLEGRVVDLDADTFADVVDVAADEAGKMAAVCGMLRGCGVGGPDGVVEDEVPQELLRLLVSDPTMRSILEMMGRMLSSDVLRDGAISGKSEVVGVVNGSDLSRLVPTELQRLDVPALRADLFRRSMEGAALVWEMTGDDDRNSGSMLIAGDRSGSMGPAMVFLRALLGTALTTARRQGRRVVLAMFDHAVEVAVVEKNGDGFGAAVSLLFLAARGGTDVEKVLTVLGKHRADDAGADTLVVTDGIFTPFTKAAPFVSRLRRGKSRIHVVGIRCDVERHRAWADAAHRVDEIDDTDEGARLVATMNTRGKR